MQETTPYILVGYRFMPSDEELIEYYLYQKVSGIPIPFVDYVVKECNIYGDEPGKIWNSYGGNLLKDDEDLYFFTKLKKKTPKGSRIDRKVGLDGGAWQGEDAPTEIVSSKNQKLIGSKKRFRYEKGGSDDNGCWIMHEYTLHASLLGKNESTNWVLCRIRKNQPTGKSQKSGKSKKRKLEDIQKSIQSVEAEPERFLTKQENKQVAGTNKLESQSSEASMVTMVQEEASCNTDMMCEEGREVGGIVYSSVPGAAQCGVAVPDQSIQTLTMVQSGRMLSQEQNQQQMFVNYIGSQYEATLEMMRQKIVSDANHRFQGGETGGTDSIDFVEQCQAPVVVVVPDHQTVMLQQDNEYDPLSELSDEDMSLLRNMFVQQPNEESVPSASVDLVTMACTGEKLSDHPVQSAQPDMMLNQQEYQQQHIHANNAEFQYDAAEVPDQTVMLHHQECLDSDPLFRIELVDEDFCPLREAWIEELFGTKIEGPGENGRSTGVNWENVQATDEMMCQIPEQQLLSGENFVAPSAWVESGVMQTMSEHPQLPYEENVIAFSDGEIARSVNVEWEATMQMQTVDEMANEVPQIAPENYGSNSSRVCLSLDENYGSSSSRVSVFG